MLVFRSQKQGSPKMSVKNTMPIYGSMNHIDHKNKVKNFFNSSHVRYFRGVIWGGGEMFRLQKIIPYTAKKRGG